MSENNTEKEISAAQQKQIWRKRAGNVMIGHYAADEGVNIYGLTLNRVSGDSDIWEVYNKIDSDYNYLDTINISQFSTASQLVKHLASYYPDDDKAQEVEPKDEIEKSAPTRSLH